jgi:hypothetical protein
MNERYEGADDGAPSSPKTISVLFGSAASLIKSRYPAGIPEAWQRCGTSRRETLSLHV